jgi:hypothetical protein
MRSHVHGSQIRLNDRLTKRRLWSSKPRYRLSCVIARYATATAASSLTVKPTMRFGTLQRCAVARCSRRIDERAAPDALVVLVRLWCQRHLVMHSVEKEHAVHR